MRIVLPNVGEKVFDSITFTNVEIVGVTFDNGLVIRGGEQSNSFMCIGVWVKLENGEIGGRYTWELGLEYNEDETDFIYIVVPEEQLKKERELREKQLEKLKAKQKSSK